MVSSYFTFLRWVLSVNIVISAILIVFVIIPEVLSFSPNRQHEACLSLVVGRLADEGQLGALQSDATLQGDAGEGLRAFGRAEHRLRFRRKSSTLFDLGAVLLLASA